MNKILTLFTTLSILFLVSCDRDASIETYSSKTIIRNLRIGSELIYNYETGNIPPNCFLGYEFSVIYEGDSYAESDEYKEYSGALSQAGVIVSIEDFDEMYETGYIYEISVAITILTPNILAEDLDTGFTYKLVELLSKTEDIGEVEE